MRWVVEVYFLTTYSHTWCLTSLKCSSHCSEINLFIWLETVWTLWLLPNSNSSRNYLNWPRCMANSQTAVELRIILPSLLRLSTTSLTKFYQECPITRNKHTQWNPTRPCPSSNRPDPQANNPTITTNTMKWTRPQVMHKKKPENYIWKIIL